MSILTNREKQIAKQSAKCLTRPSFKKCASELCSNIMYRDAEDKNIIKRVYCSPFCQDEMSVFRENKKRISKELERVFISKKCEDYLNRQGDKFIHREELESVFNR